MIYLASKKHIYLNWLRDRYNIQARILGNEKIRKGDVVIGIMTVGRAVYYSKKGANIGLILDGAGAESLDDLNKAKLVIFKYWINDTDMTDLEQYISDDPLPVVDRVSKMNESDFYCLD